MASKNVIVKNPQGESSNVASEESLLLLRRLVKIAESLGVVDSQQRQRISLDASTATVNVNALGQAGHIGNTTIQFGPVGSNANGVDSRFLLIDIAKNAYVNGIRNKLTFS